jgi:hypothetical protein
VRDDEEPDDFFLSYTDSLRSSVRAANFMGIRTTAKPGFSSFEGSPKPLQGPSCRVSELHISASLAGGSPTAASTLMRLVTDSNFSARRSRATSCPISQAVSPALATIVPEARAMMTEVAFTMLEKDVDSSLPRFTMEKASPDATTVERCAPSMAF